MVAPNTPLRIPVVGQVYWLPRDAYKSRDSKAGRPCVVVAVRRIDKVAVVVTRTTSDNRRGDIAHAAQPALSLNRPGWFQPAHRAYDVAFAEFEDAEAELLGPLDPVMLAKVVAAWEAAP